MLHGNHNRKRFSIKYLSLNFFNYLLLSTFIFGATDAIAQKSNPKVIMISIDGTPDYLIDKFLKDGVLPSNGAFARIKKHGAFAETVLPVNVASTGPSHIAIFTGASPAQNGIVGNSFRSREQKWSSTSLSAFRQPITAETIFQAAMRQGKKVMSLGAVGVDNNAENRKVNYTHMYPAISGPSLVMDLIATDTVYQVNETFFKKLTVTTNTPSQPIFEITGNFKIPLYIYMADSAVNDANILRAVRRVIVDTDDDLRNGYSVSIIPNEWATMAIERKEKQYNTSFRILQAYESQGKYRLFMNAPAEVYGYPSAFLQQLQSSCGLWPGEPENRKQTSGLISEEIWFEQIDRLAQYSRDLILAGIKQENWDLLFGYFSTLDDVQHRYTLTHPRQLDFTAENGGRPARFTARIEKYFQLIDRYLLEIMNTAPKEVNFIFFSDHGMIPIHNTLLLNNYFEENGFGVSGEELKSISSGTSAHIYINREKIEDSDLTAYITRLTQNLKQLKDSLTGEPIFELVANQEEQKNYGLFHPDYSGDLFVSCKPGYSISDRFLQGVPYMVQNSFDPVMFDKQNQATKNFLLNGTMNETGRAVHGNLATVRQGQSIFYAYGPLVPKKKLKAISSLQIAPTIAQLLGITPPSNSEKESVFKK